MARSRSVLTLLVTGALGAGLGAQDTPPQPGQIPPPPPPGAEVRREFPPKPEGDRPKPDGERRERPSGWGPPPGMSWGRGDKRGPKEELTPEQMKERALRDLEKLTPDQRNEVWRAVWAVLNLPVEKRQELIGNEDERRKKVREEVEKMIQNAGIQIPDDQRRKFFHRIFGGRREIEEQLKKEGEERRQVLMKELEGKLRDEFGGNKAVQGAIAPQSTQSPSAPPPAPEPKVTPDAK